MHKSQPLIQAALIPNVQLPNYTLNFTLDYKGKTDLTPPAPPTDTSPHPQDGSQIRNDCSSQSLNSGRLSNIYMTSQLGEDSLYKLISHIFIRKGLSQTTKEVTRACELCVPNDQGSHPIPHPLLKPVQHKGSFPGGDPASGFHPNAIMQRI